MALADRRPIQSLPVGATPASPSFNPKTLNLSSKSNSFSLQPTQEVSESESDDENIISNDDALISSRSVSPDSVLDNQHHLQQTTRDSTPPTSTSSPQSLSNQQHEQQSSTTTEPPITASAASVLKKVKKSKPVSRAPIATGISTAIPVTGEKPKPQQKGDASLEDDVLYAIFVILYERDSKGEGMTVKQICDVLSELHPEMANLSTKTSNLVSAKLNAYVKRVEKGDTSLNYAISRDWADASPKRMVYVYRGILAPGFEAVAKKLMDELKQQRGEEQHLHQQQQQQQVSHSQLNKDDPLSKVKQEEFESPKSKGLNSTIDSTMNYNDESLEAGKQATLAKPRRQTMFDLGVNKHTFTDSTGFDKINLFVPYSSAPVTASLNELTINEKDPESSSTPAPSTKQSSSHFNNHQQQSQQDFDDDEFEGVFADSDDDEDEYIESIKKNGKRSKSMSYISLNKKSKVLTAAAAAPRASRAPSSHSPNAAAAAAALHAAALRAISRANSFSTTTRANDNNSLKQSPMTLKTGTAGSCSNKKWLNAIRSGFLSQDIGAPEDTSLSDLDKFFS